MEDNRVKNWFLFIVCSVYAALLKASFVKPLSNFTPPPPSQTDSWVSYAVQ
jgi:hypothetical protein